MEHPYIPPETCMHCYEGQGPHQDWHSIRAEYLKAGAEMTRRVREREQRTLCLLSDTDLVGYGIRMRRLYAVATDDDWPDFLIELVEEWVQGAEKEWAWRRRAARLGADGVVRSDGGWTERVERVKRMADLLLLIGADTGQIKMHGPLKFSCRCPFHDDRDPSLDGDTEKGVWLCRACQIGGDAIRYAELRYGLSFSEAVKYLEERLGILPPQPARRLVEL